MTLTADNVLASDASQIASELRSEPVARERWRAAIATGDQQLADAIAQAATARGWTVTR